MEGYIFQFLLPILSVFTISFIYIAIKGSASIASASKDLHPFYTKAEVNMATKYYIPTKVQNIDPSNYNEPKDSHAFVTSMKAIPFFLKKAFNQETDDKRFYLVLADAGMGKTTFLINLYVRYKNQLFGQKYDIILLPLAYPDIDEYIKQIDDKENTILLLDGFDEDIKAVKNLDTRLNELSELTWKFREVVITCRTQFFPSAEEEPYLTNVQKFGGDKGYYKFGKMYISPFDDSDVKRYLNQKYSFFQSTKRKQAINVISKIPNLIVRPLIMSYIDEILDSDEKVVGINSNVLYKELIKKWIERESMLVNKTDREAFKQNLLSFSKRLAYEMYKSDKIRLNISELNLFIKEYNNPLSKIEISSRSLLNRDVTGRFKFSHKSIFEYLLAEYLFENNIEISNKKIEKFIAAKEFLEEKEYAAQQRLKRQ